MGERVLGQDRGGVAGVELLEEHGRAANDVVDLAPAYRLRELVDLGCDAVVLAGDDERRPEVGPELDRLRARALQDLEEHPAGLHPEPVEELRIPRVHMPTPRPFLRLVVEPCLHPAGEQRAELLPQRAGRRVGLVAETQDAHRSTPARRSDRATCSAHSRMARRPSNHRPHQQRN
jgi:hypothetical protein